jgi:hypothetical protein
MVLGLITSNLIVNLPSIGSTIPIGLFLKSTKQNIGLPGYAKFSQMGWLYSEKAIQAIEEYMVMPPIQRKHLKYSYLLMLCTVRYRDGSRML